MAESPSFPNDRWVAAYRGVLGARAFLDLRYSQKAFGFRDSGGTETSIQASPFNSQTASGYVFYADYLAGANVTRSAPGRSTVSASRRWAAPTCQCCTDTTRR